MTIPGNKNGVPAVPGNEIAAAIAIALEMETGGTVHDIEPDVITIIPRPAGGWNEPSGNFRKPVLRK